MKTNHEPCKYYHCWTCGDVFMTVGSTTIGLGQPPRHYTLTPQDPKNPKNCQKHRRSLA